MAAQHPGAPALPVLGGKKSSGQNGVYGIPSLGRSALKNAY